MSESMKIGLAVSAGVHLVLLLAWGGVEEAPVSGGDFLRIDAAVADAVSVAPEGALAIGEFKTGESADEEKLAQQRRRIYAQYLEDVDKEIHSRRLDFGRTDLIGIAVFTFQINGDGTFSRISLRDSSGSPQLDDVARKAIAASSGRVKRPKVLGKLPIFIVQEVRFQYGLR